MKKSCSVEAIDCKYEVIYISLLSGLMYISVLCMCVVLLVMDKKEILWVIYIYHCEHVMLIFTDRYICFVF